MTFVLKMKLIESDCELAYEPDALECRTFLYFPQIKFIEVERTEAVIMLLYEFYSKMCMDAEGRCENLFIA